MLRQVYNCPDATASSERREEILGELAEWMHAAAREAQRRLLDAETTDDFAKLTASLAKLARGVRQSILLHRRLEAERLAAAERAEAARAGAEAGSEFVPRHLRRVRIRTAITRHVRNEFEDDEEAELFRDDLNARLDELEGSHDFLDAPIDDLIAGLCRDLGFEPPAPDPPPLGVDREARGADARRASEASPDSAGSAGSAAPEPMAEGAGPAHGGPALHAPNTS